jgi:hypothetical protein
MIGCYGLNSFGRVAQVPGIRNEFIYENAGAPGLLLLETWERITA